MCNQREEAGQFISACIVRLDIKEKKMEIRDFFTTNSITTFVGATAVISVLANTFRILTKSNNLVVLFAISLAVAFLGAYLGSTLSTAVGWILSFMNGCLLFCTAAGVQQTAAGVSDKSLGPGRVRKQSGKPVRFFSSWFE
jgi:uncharacterized membrane protein YfcA